MKGNGKPSQKTHIRKRETTYFSARARTTRVEIVENRLQLKITLKLQKYHVYQIIIEPNSHFLIYGLHYLSKNSGYVWIRVFRKIVA